MPYLSHGLVPTGHAVLPAQVIRDARHVDAAWLQSLLRRAGVLRDGRVLDVAVESESSAWSQIVRLRPRYDTAAGSGAPATLLLKICTGDHAVFGPSEVLYYTRDYADLPDAPIPRCYDAQYASAPRGYHILMEDLGATHGNTWKMPPTLQRGCAAAEALAALHAHYWGAPRLGTIGRRSADTRDIDRYIGHIQRGLAPLVDTLGAELTADWRRTLDDIFARHPARMRARTADPDGCTLLHGDVNPGNLLAPRDGDRPIYLVDRQPFDWSLTAWLAASDLAYMMVSWWDTESRRRWQEPVLRHYHDALLRRGIAGYTWERLFADYRLAAVESIFVAVEWCVLEKDRSAMRWVWEPKLRTAMAAFADLRCAELW